MPDDPITEAFNRAGPAYAEAGAGFLDHYAEILVHRLRPQAGEQWVDLASGPGVVARAALRELGGAGGVQAIDLAYKQIELGRAAGREFGQRLRFLQQDIRALDLPDRRADAVSIGFGLPYLADPVRALREAVRITRRRGRIGLTVWGAPFFGEPGERLIDAHERLRIPRLRVRFSTDPEALASLAFRVDLRDVVVEELDHTVVFPDFDAWWRMNEAFAFLVDLSEAEQERVARGEAQGLSARVRAQLAEDDRVVQPDGSVQCRMRALLVTAQVPR